MSTIPSVLHFTLPEQFHNSLKEIAVEKDFEVHSLLFRKGDPVQGVYLIESGSVALWLTGSSEVPPRVVGPGALLGLPSTIGSRPYSLTAQAIEPVEAGFIARPEFMMELEKHPDFCLALVRGLAWEITEVRQQMSQLIEEHFEGAVGRSA